MQLLFDLDGTITDSSAGILRCINHALCGLGRPPAPEDRLLGTIGAPLTATFRALLGTDDRDQLDRAVEAYRQRYDVVGIFENRLFPGVAEALEELRRAGHAMRVVTVKPAVAARRVLAHFGLTALFDDVHGPSLADRACEKADRIGIALEAAGAPADGTVMIGDRADDVLGARRHRVRAVAAAWGYGRRADLLAAEPAFVAEDVNDLLRWLRTPAAAGGGR